MFQKGMYYINNTLNSIIVTVVTTYTDSNVKDTSQSYKKKVIIHVTRNIIQ